MFKNFDIVNFIAIELDKSDKLIHHQIKNYILNNRYTCNETLYTDPRFKETTIIISHLLKNLSCDFIREVDNKIRKRQIND